MTKIAVLLTGNIRSFDQTKYSFLDVMPKGADIFVNTYNLRWGHHPHIKNRIGDLEDETLTDDQVFKMLEGLNLKGVAIENYSDVEDYIAAQMKMVDPKFDHPTTYGQYRKLCLSIAMMQHWETITKEPYDIVIKTRPDMVYIPGVDLVPNPGEIILDSGNVYPNDCFFSTDRAAMVNICGWIWSEMYHQTVPDSFETPPHRLLHHAILNSQRLPVVKKLMDHVIRKSNYRDYY